MKQEALICPAGGYNLTRGKKYPIVEKSAEGCFRIKDDHGDLLSINHQGSLWTYGLPWKLV